MVIYKFRHVMRRRKFSCFRTLTNPYLWWRDHHHTRIRCGAFTVGLGIFYQGSLYAVFLVSNDRPEKYVGTRDIEIDTHCS